MVVTLSQWFLPTIVLFLSILAILLLRNGRKRGIKHPPGPPKFPFIGNLHQVGKLPYKSFHNLSKKYGPVMYMQLGKNPTVVVSTRETSREALRDNDQECCSRACSVGPGRLSYNYIDVFFAPYSSYWQGMRKIFIYELLSMKRVNMFWYAREEQIDKLNDILSNSFPNPVNLTEKIFNVVDGIIGAIALGGNYGQLQFKQELSEVLNGAMDMLDSFHAEDFFPVVGRIMDALTGKLAKREKIFKELDGYFQKVVEERLDPARPKPEREDIVDVLIRMMRDRSTSFQLTNDHLKAVLMDIFIGAIDTSAVTISWAFSELIKNPRIMKKVQSEIRGIIGPNHKRVERRDLDKFKYLKMVIKETLRKHPPVPLLIPHFCIKHCKIGGYDVLPGTTILVNAYSLGRDPSCWDNPELFYPERFENNEVDFRGSHFELVPFGAGRRICPGLTMGITAVEYTLANLLYGYNYELPNGMKFEDFPLIEEGGVTIHNKQPLLVIPKVYEWKD